MKGGRAQSSEHKLLTAAKTGRDGPRVALGFASTSQKPESGPDLRPPVDFLKPNYSPGSNTSLWVTQRPACSPGDPQHNRKGWSAQAHRLTRSQPDVAGISDFTLTHPQHVHNSLLSLSPLKGNGCLAWCPGCQCVYSSLWGIFLDLSSLLTKYRGQRSPYRSRKNRGSGSSSIFFPQDKQHHPQLYEFLPYSYLS